MYAACRFVASQTSKLSTTLSVTTTCVTQRATLTQVRLLPPLPAGPVQALQGIQPAALPRTPLEKMRVQLLTQADAQDGEAPDTLAPSFESKSQVSTMLVRTSTIDPYELGYTTFAQKIMGQLPPGAQIVHVHRAQDLNAAAIQRGELPPWTGKWVFEIVLAPDTKLYQAITDEVSPAHGSSQKVALDAGNRRALGRFFTLARPRCAGQARTKAAIIEAFKRTISHSAAAVVTKPKTVLYGLTGDQDCPTLGKLEGGALQVFCKTNDHLVVQGSTKPLSGDPAGLREQATGPVSEEQEAGASGVVAQEHQDTE